MDAMGFENWIHYNWLVVVSTHLKNITVVKLGNLPQIGMKIQNIWNHQLVLNTQSTSKKKCLEQMCFSMVGNGDSIRVESSSRNKQLQQIQEHPEN